MAGEGERAVFAGNDGSAVDEGELSVRCAPSCEKSGVLPLALMPVRRLEAPGGTPAGRLGGSCGVAPAAADGCG